MSHATAGRTRARFAAAMVLGAGLMVPQTSLAACAGGVYDLPSQFVGTWREYTVTDTGEVFAGTLRSELVADGCGYRQAFTGADGAFSFQSLGYVDAEEQAWRETVVTSAPPPSRPTATMWSTNGPPTAGNAGMPGRSPASGASNRPQPLSGTAARSRITPILRAHRQWR